MGIEIRGYKQGKEEVIKIVEEVISKSEHIHPRLRKLILNQIKQKLNKK